MNKILKKISLGFGMLAAAFGLVLTKAVHAAADADLANVLGTTSPGYITDNKPTYFTWVGFVFGFIILVVIVKAALSYGRRQVGGAIGGGRRRR